MRHGRVLLSWRRTARDGGGAHATPVGFFRLTARPCYLLTCMEIVPTTPCNDAVMWAVPSATARRRPVESTVATASCFVAHTTSASVSDAVSYTHLTLPT